MTLDIHCLHSNTLLKGTPGHSGYDDNVTIIIFPRNEIEKFKEIEHSEESVPTEKGEGHLRFREKLNIEQISCQRMTDQPFRSLRTALFPKFYRMRRANLLVHERQTKSNIYCAIVPAKEWPSVSLQKLC
jgi:hypothetical protein